jgi:Carboxypeptidase regulatory-like domain
MLCAATDRTAAGRVSRVIQKRSSETMMKKHIVCGRLTGGLFEAQSANIGALLIRTGLAISMAVCGIVFGFTPALQAQSTFGSVRGTAQDASGASVPGTQVTLHSTDTNTDRVVTTDSTGEFLFSNVNPGHFSITASHEGFSPATLNGISLVSGGLAKFFAIRESVHLRFESTFTNILNHTNYAPPATNISNPASFGVLTAAQTAENAGNRTGQVALRLEF